MFIYTGYIVGGKTIYSVLLLRHKYHKTDTACLPENGVL